MTKRTDNEAVRMFRDMKAKRDAGELPEVATAGPSALRIRLPGDIDLSKRDRSCRRCKRGILRYERAGGQRIPVICKCVSRGGGVKPAPELRMGLPKN